MEPHVIIVARKIIVLKFADGTGNRKHGTMLKREVLTQKRRFCMESIKGEQTSTNKWLAQLRQAPDAKARQQPTNKQQTEIASGAEANVVGYREASLSLIQGKKEKPQLSKAKLK